MVAVLLHSQRHPTVLVRGDWHRSRCPTTPIAANHRVMAARRSICDLCARLDGSAGLPASGQHSPLTADLQFTGVETNRTAETLREVHVF